MKRFIPIALVLTAAAAAAQTPVPATAPTCTVATPSFPIATEVRETSGLARGRANPDVLWTHNDSKSRSEIFAIGEDGAVRARVALKGVRLTDWEDIEAGDCAGGHCLYIADIGDNAGDRTFITVYEIVEPVLPATAVATARIYHARFENGAQDAEALFRLPDGSLYIVSKGRHGPIRLYRFSVVDVKQPASLVLVRELAGQPADELDRVTSATASPDGRWVAIRTYRTLTLYRTADLLRADGAPALTYPLQELAEKQGESLSLANDGTIWLSSEAENPRDLPTMARLKCALE